MPLFSGQVLEPDLGPSPAADAPTADAPTAQPPSGQRAEPELDLPRADAEAEAAVGVHPLLLLPLQTLIGTGVGLLATLVLPVAPFVVAFIIASAGDLWGQQRGPILWPMVGGYLGLVGGGLVPIAGWLAAFALGGVLTSLGLLLGAGMASMGGPIIIITALGVGLLYVAGAASVAVPIAAVFAAALGNGFGAAVGYYLSAENKQVGDLEFRFPGFIAPAHGAEQIFVRAPAAGIDRTAMAY